MSNFKSRAAVCVGLVRPRNRWLLQLRICEDDLQKTLDDHEEEDEQHYLAMSI